MKCDINQKGFNYDEYWQLQEPVKRPHKQLSDDLGLIDIDDLPVSPTVKVVRKYSEEHTLPDLDNDEMLTWKEMAHQLFEKDYKEIADLDKVKAEARLIVRNFKRVETEETISYSGDIKYKIYAVKKEQKSRDYRNFEKIKVMTAFGVYESSTDTSAFNTSDFEREKPEFNKLGYKIGKLKEELMDAVITYSVFVESNNRRQEVIKRAKQKLLAKYNELKNILDAYRNR